MTVPNLHTRDTTFKSFIQILQSLSSGLLLVKAFIHMNTWIVLKDLIKRNYQILNASIPV